MLSPSFAYVSVRVCVCVRMCLAMCACASSFFKKFRKVNCINFSGKLVSDSQRQVESDVSIYDFRLVCVIHYFILNVKYSRIMPFFQISTNLGAVINAILI